MTRLDSVIRRLQAQRACLDWGAGQIEQLPGVVFELGLGNGRTFDHLRDRLPERDIYVFERQVAAHPDCVPDDGHLYEGDFEQTLPRAANQHAGRCVLVHGDIGCGDERINRRVADTLARLLPAVLAPGALVISDQRIDLAGAEELALPPDVPNNRYFIRRFRG